MMQRAEAVEESSMSMEQPRVLLMGCGGIGGIIAAGLAEHQVDAVIATHNGAIADAVNARGLTVCEEDLTHVVPARASVEIPSDAGLFDFVFLATQPPQVVEAARMALPHLAEGGAIVCFQNGLCEQHVAALAGPERTIGAIVAWGGSMPEPGVYERTSEGGFVVGRLDGGDDGRFAILRTLLEPIGPVDLTHNLAGARWSKLAINCAISSLGTIGGERLGELIRHRFVRRLGLEVMSEAVAVARRCGVRLEKVSGTIDLDWLALTAADTSGPGSPSLLAKHALMLAVGAKFRRLRSSMLAAIERGREPAVDYLNGEVARRAGGFGMPVPINRRIVETIKAIWRREKRPSLAQLRSLYVESRADAYTATSAGYPSVEAPRDEMQL
jgi:2-dehydropantoate 2-reductase